MGRVAAVLVVVGLLVFALTDVVGAGRERLRGLPRALWVVIVVLLPVVGPVLWLIASNTSPSSPSGGTGGGGVGPRPGPRRPRGPVAPDDDPDFLRTLERERLEQERRRARDAGTDRDPGSADGDPSAR